MLYNGLLNYETNYLVVSHSQPTCLSGLAMVVFGTSNS